MNTKSQRGIWHGFGEDDWRDGNPIAVGTMDERDILLRDVPGFVEFHLLKGPKYEDHTLYSSHTIWSSKETFEGWTKSEAFRKAHQNAGQHRDLYIGGPNFEGFEVVQHVK